MRLAGLVIAVVLVGCGPQATTAQGIVVDVKASSVTQVDSFTLRTTDGRELVFRVGALELDDGAFPAGHLREHMALGEPITVSYRQANGTAVAYRPTDANSDGPGSSATLQP
jgi:hypothetical protein